MGTTMTECREFHHLPSCRRDRNGWQCYCKCHDVADAAPELLRACKEMLPFATRDVEQLNATLVGNLYPAINLTMLDRAVMAIAKAESSERLEGGVTT